MDMGSIIGLVSCFLPFYSWSVFSAISIDQDLYQKRYIFYHIAQKENGDFHVVPCPLSNLLSNASKLLSLHFFTIYTYICIRAQLAVGKYETKLT